jgi:hypothetical protein
MRCTWMNCICDAVEPQVARDGQKWADLCVDQARFLKEAIDSGSAKRVVRAWVRAQGGAKAAATRVATRMRDV